MCCWSKPDTPILAVPLHSNVNQVALSISAQHLNMAQDLLVVIGTCQQRQVMIPKHYFYMPFILSRTAISCLKFMLCLLFSMTSHVKCITNCLISVLIVIILIWRQKLSLCVFMGMNQTQCLHDASWPSCLTRGATAHSPPRHLAWIYRIKLWTDVSSVLILLFWNVSWENESERMKIRFQTGFLLGNCFEMVFRFLFCVTYFEFVLNILQSN